MSCTGKQSHSQADQQFYLWHEALAKPRWGVCKREVRIQESGVRIIEHVARVLNTEFWLLNTALAEPTKEFLQAPRHICTVEIAIAIGVEFLAFSSISVPIPIAAVVLNTWHVKHPAPRRIPTPTPVQSRSTVAGRRRSLFRCPRRCSMESIAMRATIGPWRSDARSMPHRTDTPSQRTRWLLDTRPVSRGQTPSRSPFRPRYRYRPRPRFCPFSFVFFFPPNVTAVARVSRRHQPMVQPPYRVPSDVGGSSRWPCGHTLSRSAAGCGRNSGRCLPKA